MIETINAAQVLLNWSRITNSNVIFYPELRIIRREVEKQFENQIYVDITKDSIESAEYMYPVIKMKQTYIVMPEIPTLAMCSTTNCTLEKETLAKFLMILEDIKLNELTYEEW